MSDNDQTDFQFLTEHSVDIICRAGPDYGLKYVSPSCFRILGWTQEEMMQAPPLSLMLPQDAHLIDEAVARTLASGTALGFVTLRMRRKDGTAVWMEVTSRQVLDSVTGEVKEYVTVLRDISERKQLEEQLVSEAVTDGLTGLANRRCFDDTLSREWKRTLREGSQISLLLIDIDHFKLVNDRYGHTAGDECLRAVSKALLRSVRAPDTVARYGGEEIAVILPSTYSVGAVKAAERLRAAVRTLGLAHEGNATGGGKVTVSIGAASAQGRQDKAIKMPESLLLAADRALYQAKRGGRNRVESALVVGLDKEAEKKSVLKGRDL